MTLTKLLLSYLGTAVVFFAIDMFWLGFLAKGIYNKYLSNFLSGEVNWPAAIIFYLIFIVGIFIFVILPATDKNSLQQAILYGALFGFFTYATYDLTNYATLKDWPIQIVLIDIAWGSILSMIVSTAGFYIVRFIK